jgi:hypothetical protein
MYYFTSFRFLLGQCAASYFSARCYKLLLVFGTANEGDGTFITKLPVASQIQQTLEWRCLPQLTDPSQLSTTA